MDYAAASAAARKFKSAVTRAKNKKDHDAVVAAVDDFEAYFATMGWPLPDNWATYDVAREDAVFAKRRAADNWLVFAVVGD